MVLLTLKVEFIRTEEVGAIRTEFATLLITPEPMAIAPAADAPELDPMATALLAVASA
jgi:hypothetical protein